MNNRNRGTRTLLLIHRNNTRPTISISAFFRNSRRAHKPTILTLRRSSLLATIPAALTFGIRALSAAANRQGTVFIEGGAGLQTLEHGGSAVGDVGFCCVRGGGARGAGDAARFAFCGFARSTEDFALVVCIFGCACAFSFSAFAAAFDVDTDFGYLLATSHAYLVPVL